MARHPYRHAAFVIAARIIPPVMVVLRQSDPGYLPKARTYADALAVGAAAHRVFAAAHRTS